MKVTFFPKTTPGKWSVGLAILAILSLVLFITKYMSASLFVTNSSEFVFYGDPKANLFYFFIHPAGIFSLASLVTGIISIANNKERSLVAFYLLLVIIIVLVWIVYSIYSM